MPKFAQYNPSEKQPSPVIGWYDTDDLEYLNLPAKTDLIDLTDAEWDARMDQQWCVSNGVLIPAAGPTTAEIDAGIKSSKANKIKAVLVALDFKKIRPMAEGDATYLATLNAQSAALRAELASL